ncbi:peptidase domain-containing ABC transporter [Fulvivirgaceae bacterium BMA12]|uniref:Peptidase domain-containing ABC transporter n=1 Tax=Agaribacillus aureus TaxID=3051825 RepID=A0ABT8L921_9BACT|nr:peptidase domain-containing ABC transporter [Fulvivirgaceae bacterium BMA12]
MKFPHYKQLDAMDCGPTCLRIIAKYYGKSHSLAFLRERSYITKAGVSLLGISEAAESIGLHTQGARLTWEQLCNEAPLPCIVHWKRNHFVVVYKIGKRKKLFNLLGKNNSDDVVFISDPALGLLTYTKEEFFECWISSKEEDGNNGITLLFATTPDFYKEKQDKEGKLKFMYLLGYLRPYAKFMAQLMLATLTGTLLSLAFPFLTQSIVDFGIGNSDLAFIIMVLVAQMVLTLGQAANSLIRSWIMLHVTTRVSISLIAGFLTKLMKLPISFFDIKMVGDIMQRIGDHSRIQSFLTSSLINIVFSTFTLVMYTFIMAGYHMGILGIFYLGSLLYVLWILLFLKKRRELDYKRFQQSSANQSNLVQLVNGMQEIKLNNCEKLKRWEWERIQAQLFKVSVKGLTLNQNQQIGSIFIDQTKNILISFLAAKAVVQGDITLGMMMAMQYIIGQLNAPVQQFIGFTQAAQDAKISLERLSEIHEREEEEKPEDNKIKEILPGNGLSINNLVFQYEGPHSEKVLNKVCLKIPSNKITAIVGGSGSGKTTLIKLLLGFYDFVEGKIELNGLSLDKYSPGEWRRKCGVVMQEGYIFSDTIANNIAVADEIPDMQKLEKAMEIANIKDFIKALPLGLKTRIGNDGHGLSSGQKQRILIARAVYKDPDYLFFDEATNALDAKNERTIMKNLKVFFKHRTVLIIAHRLSTVRDADQIIVLEEGKIAEKGMHNELVAARGGYYNLVKDQLELGG